MTRTVRCRVLRAYPRGGIIHEVGAPISIPEYAVAEATAGTLPFVEVLEREQIVLDSDFDATEGALDLARALNLDLSPYKGQGSGKGGRVWEQDVERWAAELGLMPVEAPAPAE
ncbi:MAG TPA: E3 binding domain-containing protein [Desulfobacterales bacterium]|nr:E3 binding domain-containing protein [Desulfobacterales bacterium]